MNLNKLYTIFLLVIGSIVANAASDIHFNVTVHDFGMVREGEKPKFKFEFSNLGEDSLQLQNVKASCGCTVPNWPRGSFGKNEKGEILVTYSSRGRVGAFYKTITITTKEFETVKLVIKGVVVGSKSFMGEDELATSKRQIAALQVEKTEFVLGKVAVQKSIDEKVTLTNTSKDTITIKSITAGCRCVNGGRNVIILPGKSSDISFKYTPRHLEEDSDIVVILTNDRVNPAYSVQMKTIPVESFAPKSSNMLEEGNNPGNGVFGF